MLPNIRRDAVSNLGDLETIVNVHSEEPTELHKAKTKLMREVYRTEKRTDKYIKFFNDQSEEKLLKREAKRSAITDHEAIRLTDTKSHEHMTSKYIAEVDVEMENITQLKADRLFLLQKIDKNVPAWIRSLNEIKGIAAAFGHSNKLNWRSKVLRLLRQSVLEIEDDDNAEPAKILLRKIVLEINFTTASELVRTLDRIKFDYTNSLRDGSELSESYIAMRKIDAILAKQKAVPLDTKAWSEVRALRPPVPSSLTNLTYTLTLAPTTH